MSELNSLEAAVLKMLTAGDHPALASLRQQLADVGVRDRRTTGVGFFTELDVPASSPRATSRKIVRLGDVVAQIPGLRNGAGFLLELNEGRLSCLEGYTFEEPWPDTVADFSLSYLKEQRDLGDLESQR
jgi:hypothetical protein